MYTLNLTTGVVTRNADGLQVAPAQTVDDPLYVEYLAWVNAGNSPTEYTPPVTPYTDTRITVLAFRNRFTQTEKVTIDMASIDDPLAAANQRQFAAALRVMMSDISVATYIDVARQDTIVGIQLLETYGIIAPGRAAVILSTNIAEIERPTHVP